MHHRARPSSRPSTHGRPPASITWMQLPDVSRISPMSPSLCVWAAQTKRPKTPDRVQQGKPPPSSASSGVCLHGCRWHIGVTKRTNHEGYHPVLMVHEYCGTVRPGVMNTGWHRRFSQRPGLFFGVLVPVSPQVQTPTARNKLVWRWTGVSLGQHQVFWNFRVTKLVEVQERREDSTYEKRINIF